MRVRLAKKILDHPKEVHWRNGNHGRALRLAERLDRRTGKIGKIRRKRQWWLQSWWSEDVDY